MMQRKIMQSEKHNIPDGIHHLDSLTRLMDSQFRIPGTNIRFGLDPILGLVPGFGEGAALLISGGISLAMLRHGANGMLVLRMIGNLALDALVGSIPILGDLFDVAYKANRRNLALLIRFHERGGKKGPVWPYLLGAALLILLIFIALMILGIVIIAWVLEAIGERLS